MPATVAGIHLGPDTHANRPAADAAGLPVGALYECSDHDLVYITDGSTWSTYIDHSASGGVTDHGALTGLTDDDHPQYVKDSEFTAADEVLLGTGAGTFTRLLHNFSATTAPTANEDSGDGYAVDSVWIDTTNDVVYICYDASVGAAGWQEVGAGGGVTDHGVLTGLTDDDHPQYVKDSEFTAADEVLLGTGAGTFTRLLHNFSATTAPTVNEDSGDGYAVGSIWIDVTGDTVYICYDATVGAAGWQEVGAGGGGTPASTVESETTWGISASVGTDTEYARQDHTHGTPADPGSGGSSSPALNVILYNLFS